MAQARKRKKFFDVEIPIINKQSQLQAYDPSELEGKVIKYDLTRLLRGKNVLLSLKVIKENDKLIAKPQKMTMVQSALKRMVRKGTSYVEDSFFIDCNDATLSIKPFIVSRRKIHRSVGNALRKKSREELTEYLKNKNSEEIFDELIRNHLQKPISLKLKKIYPLSAFEIRVIEIKKKLETSTTSKEEKVEGIQKEVKKA